MIIFTVALTKFVKLTHCPQDKLEPLFCSTFPFNLANAYNLYNQHYFPRNKLSHFEQKTLANTII